MKPRHTAEQSTIKVNKADAVGKKGFGALLAQKAAVTAPVAAAVAAPVPSFKAGQACPVDPQERLLCDSCQ